MTNDLELSEQCGAAMRLSRKLNHLLANRPDTDEELFKTLLEMERHIQHGLDRLNRLKPLPPLYLPSRGTVSG